MVRPHRRHSVEFNRQVVKEYLSGEESLHSLTERHDVCRTVRGISSDRGEEGTRCVGMCEHLGLAICSLTMTTTNVRKRACKIANMKSCSF